MADDHAGVSAAIWRLLVSHDYEVVGSVEDGARLLEEAARLQPDVILLDLHMPNMNPIDACRELTRMLREREPSWLLQKTRLSGPPRLRPGVRVCRKAGAAHCLVAGGQIGV